MTDKTEITAAPYRVLARKYRPQSFDDLIGQEPMVRTLTNAFYSGRIAQAYMLTGVRGVGKTTTARILARALNYKSGQIDAPSIDVREEGEHCRAILEGHHVDVIEMDAASHTGIENMREILDSVRYAPAIARYKVYIIDEVHQLSTHAFNALLKTLEEPPPHLKFVFATTEIRKVPVTVLSRCQRFDLRRIDAQTLIAHLGKIAASEAVEIEEGAAALISRAAEGSVRDALSIFDQAIAHSSGRVEVAGVREMLGLADHARVIDLFEQVMAGDIAAALGEMKQQYDIGASPSMVLSDLADFIHYVTRLKYVPQAAADPALTEIEKRRGGELAARLPVRALGRTWQILIKGIGEVEASERPLAAADMVLVRLTHAASLPAPDELIRILTSAGAQSQIAPAQDAIATNGGTSASAQGPGLETRGDNPRLQGFAAAPAAKLAQALPETSPAPVFELGRFEDLVLLAEAKREIRLRTLLRNNVRLVSFGDGRMEFNIVGNPPANFVPELSQKILAWTGRRWTLTVSREGGMASLDEQEKAEQGERQEAARSDPVVEAVLLRFPGSKIVDVKLRRELAEPLDPAASEPENREGPDNIF